jgi:SAM-dependent methyltransferase
VSETAYPYYRADLAHVHHVGFGFHADACAPGVLALLASVRERDGLVVELGCGSGHLTRHLLKGAHRVIATDASPAMLELARRRAPNVEDFRLLVLPDDPIPAADAIVSVGTFSVISPTSRPSGVLSVPSAAPSDRVASSRSTSAISIGVKPDAMRRPLHLSTTSGYS